MRRGVLAVLLVGVLLAAGPVQAQEDSGDGLAIGAMAPDFALPGATRFGHLADPVRLSDYRGQVVVIAFFFKQRTRG